MILTKEEFIEQHKDSVIEYCTEAEVEVDWDCVETYREFKYYPNGALIETAEVENCGECHDTFKDLRYFAANESVEKAYERYQDFVKEATEFDHDHGYEE